jgi:hypothetical protein
MNETHVIIGVVQKDLRPEIPDVIKSQLDKKPLIDVMSMCWIRNPDDRPSLHRMSFLSFYL